MAGATRAVFISEPSLGNSKWNYHKDFQYHYLRLDGALWFMNNTSEVFDLNIGSETKNSHEEKKYV